MRRETMEKRRIYGNRRGRHRRLGRVLCVCGTERPVHSAFAWNADLADESPRLTVSKHTDAATGLPCAGGWEREWTWADLLGDEAVTTDEDPEGDDDD